MTRALALLTGIVAYGALVFAFGEWLAPRWNPFNAATHATERVGSMSSPKVAGGDRGLAISADAEPGLSSSMEPVPVSTLTGFDPLSRERR